METSKISQAPMGADCMIEKDDDGNDVDQKTLKHEWKLIVSHCKSAEYYAMCVFMCSVSSKSENVSYEVVKKTKYIKRTFDIRLSYLRGRHFNLCAYGFRLCRI